MWNDYKKYGLLLCREKKRSVAETPNYTQLRKLIYGVVVCLHVLIIPDI